MPIKAVIFDLIGTLVDIVCYSYEGSVKDMYDSLRGDGIDVSFERFVKAYESTSEKYRLIRYQELIEVNNAVWLAEALNDLGFNVNLNSASVRKAVDAFFEGYLRSMRLRDCAKRALDELSINYKLGLISNFTHAPVVEEAIRALELSRYFSVVLISDEVGLRKPHPAIFRTALERLVVRAEEAVFIGDSPKEDVEGAKGVGMKAILVLSQFFTIEDLRSVSAKPDLIVERLCDLPQAVRTLNLHKAFIDF